MQSAGVYILPASAHAACAASLVKPLVDQRSQVLVAAIRLAPKVEEFMIDLSRHFHSAPDPSGERGGLLYVNAADVVILIEGYRVKQFGMVDRKQKQR